MTPLQIGLLILEILGGLGLLAGGLGFLLQSFKKSGREERLAVVDSADNIAEFWKKQAEEYKSMMVLKEEKTSKQINELTREVGELKGQLNSEKAQNERLERIFQNRNPEMESFMKAVVSDIQNHESFHKVMINMLESMTQVLGDIHKTSSSNSAMLNSRGQSVKLEGKLTNNS